MTVRELIRELENWDGDSEVAAYSGCHDCGGKLIEFEGWEDGFGTQNVQIIGHDETLKYGD